MKKQKLNLLTGAALFGLFFFSLLLASSPAGAETLQVSEYIPGPKVIITAEDVDAFTFVRPSIPPQSEAIDGQAATFNITFVGFPAAAETAFQYAADIWAALLTSSETINVTATWSDLAGSTLGSAGPSGLYANFSGAPIADTWYAVALAESIAGADINTSGDPDIDAQFDSTGTSWYFGTDGNPGAGEYDFVSVVLHELGHGLGFVGSMNYDNGAGPNECAGTSGQGCWEIGVQGYPPAYDRFTEDNGGTALLNTGTYPNPSAALGTALTSTSLFFDGTSANIANGGSRVPIYAPGTWTPGSSYSHLNESSYPAGNPNSLMTPQVGSAEAIHDPGQVTLCIFSDMGWDAFCNPSAVWDGGGATNDWSDADNWDTDLVPGPTSDVTFNATSAKDSIIDSSFPGTVASLTIEAAYTGMITQTDHITVSGSLTQSGGVYLATAGTLTLNGSSGTWSTTAPSSFGDVQIGDGSSSQTVTLMSDVRIGGDLTISDGGLLDAGSNTIRLGGNWLEEAFGFLPGTSTVILEGSSQSVSKPMTTTTHLDEDFSYQDGSGCAGFISTPPSGWATEIAPPGDANGDWLFGDCPALLFTPYSAGLALRNNTAVPTSFLDSWLLSPATQIFPQEALTLTFRYGVSGAVDPSDFYAYYGDGQSVADMATEVFSDTGATNTAWITAVVPITVSVADNYYFGFQNTDPSSGTSYAAFDNISLVGHFPLTFYNLTLDGNATTFSTDVVVENDMTINAGAGVDFGGNKVTVEGTFTNNGVLNQTLDVPGSATTRFFHFTDASGTTNKILGVDITPAAGMGSTTVTMRGNQSACSNNPADAFIGRCFDISPTTPGSATIRFWYTEAERNSWDANALVVWHHNGTDWELAGDTPSWSEGGTSCASGGGLECWVQVENVTDYSPFVPGANQQPTAIELQSVNIRDRWQNWPVLAAAVLLLLSSGALVRRREDG